MIGATGAPQRNRLPPPGVALYALIPFVENWNHLVDHILFIIFLIISSSSSSSSHHLIAIASSHHALIPSTPS
ncbi:hypothetical protein O181_077784 [Austropuccinia psidii MF-1]|uniref:Uncharacterized protein n=1 Tax=Austropuccinia psidii MF-1 TaxID=1389203 RepID=A0A9Q3FFL9_9BASI|nr:hypothetical protein [Austropuccinia psidii MF-1]